ncbi:MAG TPA: DUF2130 domain-containing protein [Patescibacteria group bacterium]|nr:DUF2130 domain-containing protein [Patescibacteria group bacterium]
MNTTIKCIHCGKEFPINDALSHELQEETERIRKAAIEEAQQKVADEFAKKEKEREKELLEERNKNKELLESFERKKKEDEERLKEEARLVAEKIREEAKTQAEKIREEAVKETAEKARLEKLEFEKKINDMQKALEDAQRKGKQGSQQLQGEVLELDLEEQLKANFPQDEFVPIPKGIEGGDIWQKIINPKNGNEVGSILWETKRTKNWDKKWLPKLREDTRRINGSDSIIVSQVLPDEVKSFHNIDQVWVTNYDFALHVARIVRYLLFKVAAVKSSTNHEDEELREIFNYITSDAFRHKIEAHDEAVKQMKEDLDSEIRLTQTRWKRRETQLKRLDSSVSQLYGELQGIIPTLGDRNQDLLEEGIVED